MWNPLYFVYRMIGLSMVLSVLKDFILEWRFLRKVEERVNNLLNLTMSLNAYVRG